MALLPEFSTSLRRSGQAYTQKLNQYAGVFQTIKQSQVAKQQMQQELERQMEMAEFESDLQLERQMEYYEQVQKPQMQAQRQRQAQKDWEENVKNVQTRAREMQKEFYDTYGDIADYNLFQPRFRPTFSQDGTPQLGIYWQQGDEAQPITEEEYRFRLNKLEEAAQFLRDLEQNKGDLGEGRTYVEDGRQIRQIGRDNVNSFIRDIKFNEEARKRFLNEYFNEQIEKAPVVEEEGEGAAEFGVSDAGVADLYDIAAQQKNIYTNEDEIFNSGLSVVKDNWVFNEDVTFPFIQKSQSPGVIRNKVNKFFNKNWGIDVSVIDEIPEGDYRKILNGESSGLETQAAQPIANVFDDFSQSDRKKFRNLFELYRGQKQTWRRWNREYAGGVGVKSMYEVRFNPYYEDPRNMYIPVDKEAIDNFRATGQNMRQK